MTTITRETLELAALAAGMTYKGDQWSSLAVAGDGVWQSWRPHTDIADAARLADSLGMRVSHPKHVGDGVLVEADGVVPMTVFRSDRTRQYCEAVTLCATAIGRRRRVNGTKRSISRAAR